MKKTYGVCLGMLAMGLAVLGAPASRAAGGNDTSTESTTVAATASAASSPVDLDRRIDALETELLELRTELAAKKEQGAAPATPAAAGAAQDKPSDKPTIAGLLGPTSISGFVDAYYQINFNHPLGGGVGFRAFDFRDRSINLNMIELILDKAPAADSAVGRTGYHVSVGYGDGMDIYSSFDPNRRTQMLVKEAYGSYLAPVGKGGLQIDVGKFVTPMGAEVVESKDNWNYSRGLLFAYAIPFYNFGIRAKYNLNDKYSLTGFLVNGWNNVTDNNSGKSYGMSFNGNPTKQISLAVNYLAGPETNAGGFGFTNAKQNVPASVNGAWRQTWDAVAMYTPNTMWSFMVNYDYGRGDRTVTSMATNPYTLSVPVYWTGIAGYAKYSPTANDYVAARYEYYDDYNGFTTTSSVPGGPFGAIPGTSLNASGNLKKPHYNEFTATYQHTFASYLLTRIEYRRDWSQFPVYAMSYFVPGVKYQNTVSASMIILFDSRNAK